MLIMHKILLSILSLLSFSYGVHYYVATDGVDDNPGTLIQPWETIQKAANSLSPGDIVYVRGGVYYEKVTFNISGSANDGYITFQNYEDEVAILDGTDVSVIEGDNGMFLIVDQHYLIIEGFEIRNYRSSTPDIIPIGINIRGIAHHIKLINNRIHQIETNAPVDDDLMGADAHGIAVYGTSAPDSVHNIVIDGNELYDLILGSSEGLVLNGNVSQFIISNNILHDCDNIGIDFIGFENTAPISDYDQARNGIVSNNTIYNISSFGNPAYGNSYSAGGVYVDGGRDIVIKQNTISQTDIGIEIASEHHGKATSYITVKDNLLYNNRMAGIAMGGYDAERGSTENCFIINNTLYNNDTLEDGNGEILLQFDTQDNIIKNNIFYANDQGLMIGNPFTENINNVVDYNLYFSSAGITDSEWEWQSNSFQGFNTYTLATGNDSHSLFLDPLFTDPANGDYTLQAGSPCIDAGIVVIEDMEYCGETPDMGAYEYITEECEELSFTQESPLPIHYSLNSAYPNPFNPITSLRYDLPEQVQVTLTIYDMLGRVVTQLVNTTQEAGYRSVQWNATDSFGSPVSAGVYLYQIQAGEFVQTRKMVLLK